MERSRDLVSGLRSRTMEVPLSEVETRGEADSEWEKVRARFRPAKFGACRASLLASQEFESASGQIPGKPEL